MRRIFLQKGFKREEMETLKPVKHRNHHLKTLSNYTQRTLGFGNLYAAVVLPDNEDINEWFAVNLIDFYNEISVLCSLVAEVASMKFRDDIGEGFPQGFEYRWADPKPIIKTNLEEKENMSSPNVNESSDHTNRLSALSNSDSDKHKEHVAAALGISFPQSKLLRSFKKIVSRATTPRNKHHEIEHAVSTCNSSNIIMKIAKSNNGSGLLRCSAWDYVEHVISWTGEQISNEALFPVDPPEQFPEQFPVLVKDIFKRLFRVYAIIYSSLFEEFQKISAVQHLNTSFKHFLFFVFEFKLLSDKEAKALKSLVSRALEEFVTLKTAASPTLINRS